MNKSKASSPLCWSGQGVSIAELTRELTDIGRSYRDRGGELTAERTLNLIVAPEAPGDSGQVDDVLNDLGAHSPARTIILREHGREGLDAELELKHMAPLQRGGAGTCYESIILYADEGRLAAAGSLIDPLLARGLPVVAWLPGGESGPSDRPLAALVDHVVLDTACGKPAVGYGRATDCLAATAVHDLAWMRLKYWRARVAAAFDLDCWRGRLSKIDGLEVGYRMDSPVPALLLVGWIAARAGWRLGPLTAKNGSGPLSGVAENASGVRVCIRLEAEENAPGCGGIERLSLQAGKDVLELERRPAAHRSGEAFREALLALDLNGYQPALGALATTFQQ